MADEPFLSRWSKRKTQARTGTSAPEDAKPAPLPTGEAAPPAVPREPLPPVESLTPESDFTGFMRPDVEAGVRRAALKTLFQDPRFNIMDGLDVYIDDFSKPDPLPDGWLEKLNQMKHLGAYEEKPEPAPEDPPAASAEPVEALEKPLVEQGLAPPSSRDTSDTVDSGVAPPPVPQ